MKKGEKMSEERKKLQSEKLKGHATSEKVRQQCGSIWRGKVPPTAFKEGHPAPETAFKKGVSPWNKGKKFKNLSGENSPTWKGEDTGYGPKHSWIKRMKGAPKECKHCGSTDKSERSYHWANIDHKYSRNPDDYIRLCVSCHDKYDKSHNLRKHYAKNYHR